MQLETLPLAVTSEIGSPLAPGSSDSTYYIHTEIQLHAIMEVLVSAGAHFTACTLVIVWLLTYSQMMLSTASKQAVDKHLYFPFHPYGYYCSLITGVP